MNTAQFENKSTREVISVSWWELKVRESAKMHGEDD